VNEPRSRYLRTSPALAGALMHGDVDAEGSPFVGAGVLIVKYGIEQMTAMRDGMLLLWSGPLFLIANFALSAFLLSLYPPSGFQIIADSYAAASWRSW
jgi:hydrogenase-4 component F